MSKINEHKIEKGALFISLYKASPFCILTRLVIGVENDIVNYLHVYKDTERNDFRIKFYKKNLNNFVNYIEHSFYNTRRIKK